MEKLTWRYGAAMCGLLGLLVGAQAQTAPPDAVHVAEQQRQVRPTWAPRVLPPVVVDEATLQRRLHGIVSPVPANTLATARSSGAWFMPMFGPGLTGPYDLRAWHPHAP